MLPIVALDLVSAVAPLADVIARKNRALADQVRRAVASVALNVGEGDGRRGADRSYHFGVALASAREVRMALQVAVRFGHRIDPSEAERIADHFCRLAWGATR
jgi:four helix bundle protein